MVWREVSNDLRRDGGSSLTFLTFVLNGRVLVKTCGGYVVACAAHTAAFIGSFPPPKLSALLGILRRNYCKSFELGVKP
jgi:hypothetical protein